MVRMPAGSEHSDSPTAEVAATDAGGRRSSPSATQATASGGTGSQLVGNVLGIDHVHASRAAARPMRVASSKTRRTVTAYARSTTSASGQRDDKSSIDP